MESSLQHLVTTILSSGSPAVMAILLLVSFGLGFLLYKREGDARKERKELIEHFQQQIESDRDDLLSILEKYQEGQLNVVQAINEIKILIATIGAKL